jgi:hypothetical protein
MKNINCKLIQDLRSGSGWIRILSYTIGDRYSTRTRTWCSDPPLLHHKLRSCPAIGLEYEIFNLQSEYGCHPVGSVSDPLWFQCLPDPDPIKNTSFIIARRPNLHFYAL